MYILYLKLAGMLYVGLWDTMMDIRISVQKILLAVNCLPQSTDWASKLSHSDAECGDAIKHGEKTLLKMSHYFICTLIIPILNFLIFFLSKFKKMFFF